MDTRAFRSSLSWLIGLFALAAPLASSADNLGSGRLDSVNALQGCLGGPNGVSVQSWEVRQGGLYTLGLVGTECTAVSGLSIRLADTFSPSGCAAVTQVTSGSGSATFRIQERACETTPVKYWCNNKCQGPPSFARRKDGVGFQAHLRASDASCQPAGTVGCHSGACCDDGGCSIRTAVACASPSTYRGDATVCDPNPCSQAPCTPSKVEAITCGSNMEIYTSEQGGLCTATLEVSAWAFDDCGNRLDDITWDPPLDPPQLSPLLTLNKPGETWAVATVELGSSKESCTQYLTLMDDTEPVISCAGETTVECVKGGAPSGVTASATDNCDGVLSCTCSPVSLDLPLGNKTVTCTAKDSSGNEASCERGVTYQDTLAPTISCPDPKVVKTSETASCTYSWSFTASASDQCDGGLAPSCSPYPLARSGPGTAPATCTATDSVSLFASCTTSLTVVDDVPPTVTIGAIGNNGTSCVSTPVTIHFAVSDDCGVTQVHSSCGPVSWTPGSATGSVTYAPPTNQPNPLPCTITAVDGSGNGGSATTGTLYSRMCYCSYTQGGWGANCHGGNPGCIRDTYFGAVYPSCMQVGEQCGCTNGCGSSSAYHVYFTSAAKVNSYLPQTGTPAQLTTDKKDATSGGGTLGGNTAALRLNVDYDSKGVLSRPPGIAFKDLVIVSGPYAGKKVQELLDRAELVLSKAVPANATELSNLTNAASAINNDFDGCRVNSTGYLRLP